jgi:hypothetical protein
MSRIHERPGPRSSKLVLKTQLMIKLLSQYLTNIGGNNGILTSHLSALNRSTSNVGKEGYDRKQNWVKYKRILKVYI